MIEKKSHPLESLKTLFSSHILLQLFLHCLAFLLGLLSHHRNSLGILEAPLLHHPLFLLLASADWREWGWRCLPHVYSWKLDCVASTIAAGATTLDTLHASCTNSKPILVIVDLWESSSWSNLRQSNFCSLEDVGLNHQTPKIKCVRDFELKVKLIRVHEELLIDILHQKVILSTGHTNSLN